MSTPLRPRTLFWRALRLKCPACGGTPVVLSWFREAPGCPRCGFRLDRAESGYWLGSYTVNLFVTLGMVAAALVAAMIVTWPDVPWTGITVSGALLSVALPVAMFPWTKTFYLAIDMMFRPPEEADFVSDSEPARKALGARR